MQRELKRVVNVMAHRAGQDEAERVRVELVAMVEAMLRAGSTADEIMKSLHARGARTREGSGG